tara:strand:+ start:1216 stop:1872 length:657 start_codon:yes stop_codon:yes gene_type:complete
LRKNNLNIKLVYFDFNFWRVDILRLCLSFANIPYEYERIPREKWVSKKNQFPFRQLPVMFLNDKVYAHTHSLARFCAHHSNLLDVDDTKILIIDQVIDWANDITLKIGPSIRAEIREKNLEKAKSLRLNFIKNDLENWFLYLEKLFVDSSAKKEFFTDRFSVADIVAWRLIQWFTSGILNYIDTNFINDFYLLKKLYHRISNIEKFKTLSEFKEILKN